MRQLVIATLNPAKGRELAGLLADIGIETVLLADVPGATLPPETEGTYAGNARVKARAAVSQTGLAAVGDDSGLEVDALGGAPGIRSARFGGLGLDDAARIARLLEALAGVPDERRTARFRCVLSLVEPGGRARTVEGVVEGRIAPARRGDGGFGYDPVFVYPPLGLTFGELPPEEKARLSHRALAVRALGRLLGE